MYTFIISKNDNYIDIGWLNINVSLMHFCCFRLQTRQWSERVIRRETREWKVHGNMTIRKEVQVCNFFLKQLCSFLLIFLNLKVISVFHYACDLISCI